MNQFEYFTEIEEAFVRLRGKSLLLSPMDWDLIQIWKDEGVPLHVALRAIEQVFESHQAKARRRPINSLSYCRNEVAAQFAEWRESRVGANEDQGQGGTGETGKRENDPFAKDALLAHLVRKAEELTVMKDKLNNSEPLWIAVRITVNRVIDRIRELLIGLQVAERVDAQKLEAGLTQLEEILDQAFAYVTPAETTDKTRATAEAQLKPYKSHMEPDAYAKQVELLLKKRLRDIHGVPRLSLFYL